MAIHIVLVEPEIPPNTGNIARSAAATDGVTEASDEEGNLFGTERMIEALNRAEGDDPGSILRHMYDAIDEFEGKAEQFDDTTMLCLKYNGLI